MTRRLAAAVLVLAAAGGLTACIPSPPTVVNRPIQSDTDRGMTEVHVLLSDGRTVTCIKWRDGYGTNAVGGLVCDWATAAGTGG